MRKLFLVWIFLFFLSTSAFAELEYYLWQPLGASYPFLLTARQNETPQSARLRFIKALKGTPGMEPFAIELEKFKDGGFHLLNESEQKLLVLAQANSLKDLSLEPGRLREVLGPLTHREIKIAILPPGIKYGITQGEFQELRVKVASQFDVLISVGGDDIDPAFYGRKSTFALHTNPARDASELAIVKAYLEAKSGFFAGICRGNQIAGVASGCTLIQDIEKELRVEHPQNTKHLIVPTKDAGALTKRLFQEDPTLLVNSIHHQSVYWEKKARAKITAKAADTSIAEVVEYADGHGIGVQFHPESLWKDEKTRDLHERFYKLLLHEGARAREMRLTRAKSTSECRNLFQLI